MSNNKLKEGSIAAVAVGAMVAEAGAANDKAVEKLIAGIKDKDANVRTEAWLGAGDVGAAAVKPLAAVMRDSDLEVARAAKRALWKIVRHTGRPRARREKKEVVAELLKLLGDDQPVSIRREVLWMLSEIARGESVGPVAAFLASKELREDARMVLERIPGKPSLKALKAGLETAPDDFKPNIAQSLRKRGVEVPGIPCAKLAPTKKTDVKPLQQ